MTSAVCYYCDRNNACRVAAGGETVPYKASAPNKLAGLRERIFYLKESVKLIVKAHPILFTVALTGAAVAAISLLLIISASVTVCVLPIFFPVLVATLKAEILLIVAFFCIFGVLLIPYIAGLVAGSTATTGLIIKGMDIVGRAQKQAHALGVNPERYRNQKVCLVLETAECEGAFPEIRDYQLHEHRYPVVFKTVYEPKDLQLAVDEALKTVKEIKMLVIRGHGNQYSIKLSSNQSIHADQENRRIFEDINRKIGEKAPIFLDSCGTAKRTEKLSSNIAQLVSCWCRDHDVWASKESLNALNLRINRIKPLDIEIRTPKYKKIEKTIEVLCLWTPRFISRRLLTKDVVAVYRNGILQTKAK